MSKTFLLFKSIYICDMTVKKKQADNKEENFGKGVTSEGSRWQDKGMKQNIQEVSRFQYCSTFEIGDGFMGACLILY